MTAEAQERSLLIVSAGRMGDALIRALAAGRTPTELAVGEVSPARREELTAACPDVGRRAPVLAAGAVRVITPGDVADAVTPELDDPRERVSAFV